MSSGPYALGSTAPAAHYADDGGGNYGPVIGVLVFIALLTAGSVAAGRLFVGRQAFQRTGFDLEEYVERSCGLCVGSGLARAARRPRPPMAVGAPKKPSGAALGGGVAEVQAAAASDPPEEVVDLERGAAARAYQ